MQQDRLALATPRGDDTVADRLETDRARLASLETQVRLRSCSHPAVRLAITMEGCGHHMWNVITYQECPAESSAQYRSSRRRVCSASVHSEQT